MGALIGACGKSGPPSIGIAGSGASAGVVTCAGGEGGGAGSRSGTACGFPMPNPASTDLPNPASYCANNDGTITDNVTGLTWEGRVDPGMYTQAQAATYCASRGGAWRLPTRLELVSLMDSTIASAPTIDRTYFSNTPAGAFWTSSAYAPAAGHGWLVSFNDGDTFQFAVDLQASVRCVQVAAPRCFATRYQSDAAGLVLDNTTGLTWQQPVDAGVYAWADAKTYCAGLGAGWRLPSLTELQSIVDDTKMSPSIDREAFPNTPALAFWSSSSYTAAGLTGALPSEAAWIVGFKDGSATGDEVAYYVGAQGLRVRCVR